MSVEKGECVKVDIVDFGSKGEGVGKFNGFTVFVPGGVPGDVILARITLKKKNYAKGKIEEIIEASKDRIAAPCEYFGTCGGCQIQNVSYDAQLKYKRKKVYEALKRIGNIEEPVVNETIGMDEPYGYRNKGQFPVKFTKGKAKIGFYQIGSHELVDIKACPIQDEVANKVLKVIRNIINQHPVSIYNEKKHQGILRHVVIRTAFKSKDTMVILVTNGYELPFKSTFIESLSKIKEVKSIIQNINTRKGNRIMGFKNRTVHGEDVIKDEIDSIDFEISPLSFFQVNPIQTEKLYNKALEYAELSGNEVVYDLYCGIGSISLFLANKAKKVYGVEVVEAAIEDAKSNAKRNNIENVEFITGKSEEVIPKMYGDGKSADVVVVDPPRKGCDESLLETLVEMKPERIVYVSCKPSTLARDVKYLTEKGFEFIEAQPVDMFPHSTHIENVCLLKKK